jgi:hypothetical protein
VALPSVLALRGIIRSPFLSQKAFAVLVASTRLLPLNEGSTSGLAAYHVTVLAHRNNFGRGHEADEQYSDSSSDFVHGRSLNGF